MYLIFFFLFVVVVPGLFWLWFFRRKDVMEPEPKKLLAKLFFIGAGLGIFAAGVEHVIFNLAIPEQYSIFLESGPVSEAVFWSTLAVLLTAAVIEEAVKYAGLKGFAYRSPHFNQIGDGIIYAVAIALGFGILENAGYFIDLYFNHPTETFIVTSIFRGTLTLLLHITAAGFIGYALGKKKFSKDHSNWFVFKGVVAATALHGFFNVSTLFDWGLAASAAAVFLSFAYLLRLYDKTETRIVWRLVEPPEES